MNFNVTACIRESIYTVKTEIFMIQDGRNQYFYFMSQLLCSQIKNDNFLKVIYTLCNKFLLNFSSYVLEFRISTWNLEYQHYLEFEPL